MLELADIQVRFSAALQDREADGLDEWVQAKDLAADRRVSVYRNNSRIAQTEALAGIYPAVQQLVGEAFFERLAERYRAQYPSTSGDLRDYGAGLARFLSTFEPVAELPYLPDVAHLEWAWHECFHAAAAEPVEPSDLTALATEHGDHAGLSLIPAARLLASPYPVGDIWAFALDPERQQEGLNLDGLNEAYLLVARSDEQVEVMQLTPGQFFWLESIARGDNLADAFEQTLARHPDFDLATGLAVFVRLGVLTKG